jgi:hypothetical protein
MATAFSDAGSHNLSKNLELSNWLIAAIAADRSQIGLAPE